MLHHFWEVVLPSAQIFQLQQSSLQVPTHGPEGQQSQSFLRRHGTASRTVAPKELRLSPIEPRRRRYCHFQCQQKTTAPLRAESSACCRPFAAEGARDATTPRAMTSTPRNQNNSPQPASHFSRSCPRNRTGGHLPHHRLHHNLSPNTWPPSAPSPVYRPSCADVFFCIHLATALSTWTCASRMRV